MEPDDETIAKSVQTGNTDAFGVLIDRYEKKLKRYAKKFLLFEDEAVDVVQDVFIKAYTNIQSFNTRRRFSPWIYRIAHNTFINEIKRREKAPVSFFEPDSFFPQLTAEEEADSFAKERETKDLMREQLSKLPVKYREPIVLYYFEGMAYKDIAQVLRVPVATVGVRINRAKKILQKEIQ